MTYANLAQVRVGLHVPETGGWSEVGTEEALEVIAAAADYAIDKLCGVDPNGFLPPESVSTRKYWARSERLIITDDIATRDDVVIHNQTSGQALILHDDWRWVSEPNAVDAGWGIRRLPRYVRGWYVDDEIRVTAMFGWPAVPPALLMAANALCRRMFASQELPLGIIEAGDMAMRIARNDPTVMAALTGLRGRSIAVSVAV